MLLYWRSQAWAAQPLSTNITSKAPPLKGKHKITQHLAFVAVFFFFFLVPPTSWYHILGRRCVSISIVSNWNKCKLLFFFFFFRKWYWGFGVGSGASSLDNIYSQPGSHLGCTSSFLLEGWFTSKHPFGFPLSGNHIHWHSREKQKQES